MPKPKKFPLRLLTRSELALAFRVPPLRVTKWVAAGCPVANRGGRGRESRYALPAVVAWEIERRVQARGGSRAGAALDLPLERAKLAKVQTEKTAIDLKTRTRELLPRQQVVDDGRAFVLAVRAKLLALPRRLVVAAIVPPARQRDVASLIREALEEMSRWSTHLDLLDAAGGGTDDDSERTT